MEDKTATFKEIINTGSIKDIHKFLLHDFHSIKHTESFACIVNRLEREKRFRDSIVCSLDSIQQEIAKLVNTCRDGKFDL